MILPLMNPTNKKHTILPFFHEIKKLINSTQKSRNSTQNQETHIQLRKLNFEIHTKQTSNSES